MKIPTLFTVAAAISPAFSALEPLHTSSRWILDSNNQRFKLRCVNWAGHMEAHLPEGLQHNSLSNIVDIITSSGFNCVRLTFSIDMVLQAANERVESSFATLAGRTGANEGEVRGLWDRVKENNGWISEMRVLEAWGKVVDALGEKGVRVILDNHVSKASWCCNLSDGNGWWSSAPLFISQNSRFFDTNLWLQGLSTISTWSRNHPAVAGIGIRNELRAVPVLQDNNNHRDWYDLVTRGARSVHDANPDLLIAIGGVWSSTDASFLRTSPLDRSSFGNKIVWEWHTYTFSPPWITTGGNCFLWKQAIGGLTGFLLTQNQAYTGPLWLSEFGFPQSGGPDEWQGIPDEEQFNYAKCLVEYVTSNDGDWAIWALQGNYYVRDGKVDYEEGWGLLNREWTAWKNERVKGLLGDLWKVTQGP